ncbi:hypothetical protein PP175_28135 (plasmid) [Aneurinibacillus sp. Ricciae_BoGa-3]|uniref:hypothetical protein n=1 Tax=Aneurinibacillus sp. Ricciae_BoGa-3 TaxID=3022697 RepID=UPI002340517D|nr:hypothetical protein [Aneurinibacillus sp. Ricciae_BoGa-3]WCK57060.1 hypothetical protein PP175_28135 [Aneurinibacillus sp. Ricciae_BoGa-3]
MATIKLTVLQLLNLGLWEKVCEYKGWSPWIFNEGRIREDELVEFDDEFKREEERNEEYEIGDKFESNTMKCEIVAKVKHKNKEEYVYLVKVSETGEEDVEYKVFDEFSFSIYEKLSEKRM